MKKLLILLVIFFSLNTFLEGQPRKPVKTDTAKTKLNRAAALIADTPKVKFPLNIPTGKFDRIDSADLRLTSLEPIQKYGYVDTADLRLKFCDFEKDANAMVLFDRAEMAVGIPGTVIERHKRIKIFNDNGKSEANIRIEYNNRFGEERIAGIEGQTITLVNGKIEYTKLDIKLIYGEHTNKNKDAIVFTMPNVKAGSIIEYRYTWERVISRNVPQWAFQCNLPTRYSQINCFLNPAILFTALSNRDQPYVKDTTSMMNFGHVWALANVPSAKEEPFMRSAVDALQSLTLIISSIKLGGKTKEMAASWADIGKEFAADKEINKAFDQNLHDEDVLIDQAKALKSEDEKIAFLFNQVKTSMKWNEEENWLSKDGIKSAWKKKSGNWGEINMVLYHLLKQANIKAYPMLVSTRNNGRINPSFINIYQINKLVIYIPVDTARYYVLDATDKYNAYNEIPFDLLNSYGLYINKAQEKYELVLMKKQSSVKNVVFVNAEIKPDGTMDGTAQIENFSYAKSINLELHKKLDDKKYLEYLTDNDNNLKIKSLKLENAEVDSLPLIQKLDFNLNLPGTDGQYIYFNPNLFTSLHSNPFMSENRVSDIDFGCSEIYSINGRYKIPPGYKIDFLPKSLNMMVPDKSIVFRRVVGEQEGHILVNYTINYKKSVYPNAEYPDVYAYFKKMTETLNEQIVLKKL